MWFYCGSVMYFECNSSTTETLHLASLHLEGIARLMMAEMLGQEEEIPL